MRSRIIFELAPAPVAARGGDAAMRSGLGIGGRQHGFEELPAILPRILVVGDDAALRRSLIEQLERHAEFACVDCPGAASALAAADEASVAAVVLDGALAGADAAAFCRLLRRSSARAPIIVLTGADDCPGTLAEIADDRIAKPIRLNVLLERLRRLLHSDGPAAGAALKIGPFDFRAGAKLLIDAGAGRRIRLTEKETAILDYLYRAGDRVIDRDTLLRAVWGYRAAISTHTLETHVYRLRRKIEPDPAAARILVTEAGGYRLVP